MAPTPNYPLNDVQSAAERDAFTLGRKRAEETLYPYFQGDIIAARRFVREVAMRLMEADFIETVTDMYGGPFDVYGVRIGEEDAKRHGIEHARTWYIKLKIVEKEEKTIFFISFHGPEKKMWTQRGPIDP